ncbi:uncharacterized protein EV422DRAFT_580695 [Fimicolochytrium jonesii]|uniref:uncharacterized protein n=1 Tax=Fimicolochytrium jonesii TaxID=1396493 RepID=UPI0022FE31A3|nr:uncharacterized protein EV422DRAFT_580695 [Fimicolochytrium jonesii]KAI8817625.1 hypothetical protein EV422DRAFT_580695 [Fimicolochytrium jonesii]
MCQQSPGPCHLAGVPGGKAGVYQQRIQKGHRVAEDSCGAGLAHAHQKSLDRGRPPASGGRAQHGPRAQAANTQRRRPDSTAHAGRPPASGGRAPYGPPAQAVNSQRPLTLLDVSMLKCACSATANMSSHQALQGHLWWCIFTGATTPRQKRRKVALVTQQLPICLPATPLQTPRFELPPSVHRHLPQAIADMVGESSGDEDRQQQQPQRGLSPADRGLQRPLNLPAPIPFRFPSTPGGSLVYEPPPPPPAQRPRPQTHASTKVLLHRIIHNQVQREQRERLTTFVGNVHILARHTSFFLKYYLADHPLHDFPDITDKHISVIFELLNNPGYNGNPVIVQVLHPWVQDYCDVHGFAPIRMQYCHQTAAYTATSIFTNLKVNAWFEASRTASP